MDKKTEKQSLVSIIVPTYNAEQYLDECVSSLLDQTYSNIEIILINDGSSDRTEAKCMEWAARSNKVIYHKQTNRGPAASRNKGFSLSKGKTVMFVDADDRLDPAAIKTLVDYKTTYQADLVCFDMYLFDDKGAVARNSAVANPFPGLVVASADEYREAVLNQQIGHFSVLHLFSRTVLERMMEEGGIYREDLTLYEDVNFIHRLPEYIQKVVFCPNAFYGYRQNSASLTKKNNLEAAASGYKSVCSIDEIEVPDYQQVRKNELELNLLFYLFSVFDEHQDIASQQLSKDISNKILDISKRNSPNGLSRLNRLRCTLVKMRLYGSLSALLRKIRS